MDEMIFAPCSDVVLFSQPVTDMSAIVMHEEVGNFTPRPEGVNIELPSRAGQFGVSQAKKTLACMHKYFEMDSFK